MSEGLFMILAEGFGALVIVVLAALWGRLFWGAMPRFKGGKARRKPERSDAYNRHVAELRRRRRAYTVCAWCGLKYDRETREVYRDQPGWAPFWKSHGICSGCEEVERKRLGLNRDKGRGKR